MSKVCAKCKVEQPLDAFNWANRAKGKRQEMCRTCFSAYNRARYEAKREQIIGAVRARERADPEKVRAESRRAYARHREARRAAAREYQRTHDRKAYKEAWARADRAANPEKWRAKGRRDYAGNRRGRQETQWRRRAAKMGTEGIPLTPVLLAAKWDYWAGRCWMCGGEALEWDHVKPLSKGGAHCLANLRPA
jgi:hypothetical protein